MNDLKDDSAFVLRGILILGIILMYWYSKTGTYLWFLIGSAAISFYMHLANRTPLVNQLMYSTIIISIAFELIYPVLFSRNRSTFLKFKKEFDGAREELKRRKNSTNVNKEL